MKKASLKAEKGLIEVELQIADNIITSAKITGDFFIHPEESIEEFEDLLNGLEIDENIIRKKIQELYDLKNISTPGISIDDWIEVLFKAIKS